jgi:dTMP kinase
VSRGFFLVVEGPEGAGKSTLAAALARRMQEQGIEPVAVREPGGTAAAERIRDAFLDPTVRFDPGTELLYIAAARAHLVQEIIRPALAHGRVVISDRFDLSTRAYQGAGRGIDAQTIGAVNQLATGGLRPDLTLVLDLAPALGKARQRAAGKASDRMEREEPGFHERVARAYLAAAGDGVRHLDGTLAPDALLDSAWSELVTAAPETFRGVRR